MRLFILLLWLFPFSLRSLAQETPLLCQYPDDRLGGQDIFARQEWDNNRLVLVSWNTSETVQELETAFVIESFKPIRWTPQCRYLLAEVGINGTFQMYAWDTWANSRIGFIDDSTLNHRISVSPDGTFVVMQLRGGGYLWNVGNNQQFLLNPERDEFGRSFYSTEWDIERNQLLAVQTGSLNGVTAYDLNTGQQVGFYHVGNGSTPVNYRRLANNQDLLVYSIGTEIRRLLAYWDRDTGANIQLDPNYEFFGMSASYSTFDLLGDLDSRYLILDKYGLYFGQLYVWDLQNLVGTSPYIPNYQQHLEQAGTTRMLNENVLEVADWKVWSYVYTPASIRSTLIHLDTFTLEQFEKRILTYQNPCDDNQQTELVWACEATQHVSFMDGSKPGVNNAMYWHVDIRYDRSNQ